MSRRRSRRSRPLGALLDNVQPWQIAVGIGVVGGAIWFLTRPKKQSAVTVNVAVPGQAEPVTDLVVTGSSAPPAQTGITSTGSDFVGPPAPPADQTAPSQTKIVSAGSSKAVTRKSRVPSSTASRMRTLLAKRQRGAASSGGQKNIDPNDPCAGLTGRAALDCRSAAAQADLDANLS